MAQRPILHIIRPNAGESIGPVHIRSLKDAAKDKNPGKPIGIDLSVIKSKTGQGYIESSDAYKKWTEALEVPDLHCTRISRYQFIKIPGRV